MFKELKKRQFLFEELVLRDFKQKYKRTALGMVWSILSPLLTLLIMKIVFTQFFGRNTPHYTIYLFSGNLVMAYFRESTRGGMYSLTANSSIFSKVNVPKYMFVLSKNTSSLCNFCITMLVYFLFCLADGINFGTHMFALLYPISCLLIFNIGMGLILSAMYLFFRDTRYLYDVFLTLLNYMSAIFYTVDAYPQLIQNIFMLNPMYCYIRYIRLVVINGVIPSPIHHFLCAFYAAVVVAIGAKVYRDNNHKFLYYI